MQSEAINLLIAKFKEVKEELTKNDSSVLHSNIEGFMGSLKTLPKGSPERGKLITQHMSHPPFIAALNAHPQGKQMHSMLMGHLNSKANAGFKPGMTQMMVKNDEGIDIVEELEKAMFGNPSQTSAMRGGGSTQLTKPGDMSRAHTYQSAMAGEYQPKAPVAAKPAPVAAPAKKLTGLDRIKAMSQQPITKADLLKQSCSSMPFGKTVNEMSTDTNMAMSRDEKLTLNKGGQWNLDKAVRSPDQSSTNTDRSINPSLGGKYGKVHGGDPRKMPNGGSPDHHVMNHPTQGDLLVENVKGKMKARVSGASSLRNQAARDETGHEIEKNDDKTVTSPPKLNAQGKAEASAPKGEWSSGQVLNGRSIPLARGNPNQVHVDLPKSPAVGTPGKVTSSIPKLKPAGEKYARIGSNAPTPGSFTKKEDAENCSRCKKKPCVCIKTDGVLVER